jgi:2,3-bisphosphoglycerate-dependent phosphoglycerate mutase
MITLDCIRHGKTRSNEEGRYNGTSQDSLTREQSARLATIHFDSSSYDAIFCSPLRRCVETAQHLRISNWVMEPQIVERSFGILEGLTQEECRAQYPAEFAAFRAFDQHYVVPGGESRGAHHARMTDWIRSIAQTYRNVLAITHGGMIDWLYRLGAGQPLYDLEGGIKAGNHATLFRFEVQWPRVRTLLFDVELQSTASGATEPDTRQ